jgi:hypothetical protein
MQYNRERLPMTQLALVILAIACALSVLAILAAAKPSPAEPGRSAQQELRVTEAGGGDPGPLSPVQKKAIKEGPLVPNEADYERDKAAANARAPSGGEPSQAAPGSAVPTSFRSWDGVFDTNVGPSDSTGAIGTNRYIELVNATFAIYNRTSDVPLSTGSLASLVGAVAGANVFDPQVIWDPATKRFYYVTDTVISGTDNRVSFGFSKTASPSSAADFCKYEVSHGSAFPDYPKLGDLGGAGNNGLILYGSNTFSGTSGAYLGSDIYSLTKPPAGTTCPAPNTFTVGAKFSLKDSDATTPVFTPVPANQTDTSSTGYAVANSANKPSTRIPTFRITKSISNQLVVDPVRNVTVASYDIPAAAQQAGTTRRLDTLDSRHTQAVSAIDPSRGGVTAIWTQHTVFGGAGARVRWYEINPNPATPVLFQSGTISGASTGASNRYVYNAAISPDRQRKGSTAKFGSNMVIGFNTSSTTQTVDIRMASKIGNNAVTFQATPIRTSPASLDDFTCTSGTCRWGDYSAATPDPATPLSASSGQVWLTNGFVRTTGGSSGSGWGTRNWAATP